MIHFVLIFYDICPEQPLIAENSAGYVLVSLWIVIT